MDGFDMRFADKFLAPDACDGILDPFETYETHILAFIVGKSVF